MSSIIWYIQGSQGFYIATKDSVRHVKSCVSFEFIVEYQVGLIKSSWNRAELLLVNLKFNLF